MSDSEQLFHVPTQRRTNALGYCKRDYKGTLGKSLQTLVGKKCCQRKGGETSFYTGVRRAPCLRDKILKIKLI